MFLMAQWLTITLRGISFTQVIALNVHSPFKVHFAPCVQNLARAIKFQHQIVSNNVAIFIMVRLQRYTSKMKSKTCLKQVLELAHQIREKDVSGIHEFVQYFNSHNCWKTVALQLKWLLQIFIAFNQTDLTVCLNFSYYH